MTPNEGFLGRFEFSGERAATDNHPVVLQHLPLADGQDVPLQPGTILKRVDGAWDILTADDAAPAALAVVDSPCDPTGDGGETSALCVVHGCVKTRLLKLASGQAADQTLINLLMDKGIYAC